MEDADLDIVCIVHLRALCRQAPGPDCVLSRRMPSPPPQVRKRLCLWVRRRDGWQVVDGPAPAAGAIGVTSTAANAA